MSDTWWPAAGWRTSGSGAIGDVGGYAYYWSSTRHSNAYQSYNLAFNYGGYVGPSNSNTRSYGFSVRCVQEEGQFRRPRPPPNPLLFYAARPTPLLSDSQNVRPDDHQP